MSPVSDTARAVAKAAAAAIGGKPHVDAYYDEGEAHRVDILACADRPTEGVTTWSTVTLHEAENRLEERDIRVELCAVAPSPYEEVANLLATAAFGVIKDGWLAAPGVVFPDLVKRYDLSETLEHVLWTPPFYWPQLGSYAVSGDLKVQWLLAMPISESEREYLVENGLDAFEELLERNDVGPFDYVRDPIV
jgi:hypothetical protein